MKMRNNNEHPEQYNTIRGNGDYYLSGNWARKMSLCEKLVRDQRLLLRRLSAWSSVVVFSFCGDVKGDVVGDVVADLWRVLN
jgi:hypothetical protein